MPFLTCADDNMIFAKATNESCHIIKSILEKYCSMSDKLVNFHKSAFQCTSKVSPEDYLRFQNILMTNNAFSLGTYLGCPIIDTRVTKNIFGDVLDRIVNQLTK